MNFMGLLRWNVIVPVMGCVCVSHGVQAKKRVVESKPNIVIILADDLGFGDISAYGENGIRTPNIDRIAREGIRFCNGYAASSTSTPSRYSLLTGRYPWREGAQVLNGNAPLLIREGLPTLPRMLQAAGYVTGVVGKWHLGLGNGDVDWNGEIAPGAREVGFDYSFITAATNDRVPTVYVENGKVVGLDPEDPIEVSYTRNFPGEPTGKSNPELLKFLPSHGHDQAITNGISRIGFMKGGKAACWVDETMGETFLAKASEFVKQHKDQPFFLYYALHQPHVPRVPNPRFAGKSSMGARGDVILEADWCVGEFLKLLDSLALSENTIVIFSSDNGPVLDDGYQDGAIEKLGKHKPAGPFRSGKYSSYDGGTHVAFLLRWQGHVRPGSSDALVSQLDLYASLAALLGQPDETADGENVLKALLGKSGRGRKELLLEATGENVILRRGNWIYIPPMVHEGYWVPPMESGRMEVPQLFNVKKDAGQQENVADRHPVRVRKMDAALRQIRGIR